MSTAPVSSWLARNWGQALTLAILIFAAGGAWALMATKEDVRKVDNRMTQHCIDQAKADSIRVHDQAKKDSVRAVAEARRDIRDSIAAVRIERLARHWGVAP